MKQRLAPLVCAAACCAATPLAANDRLEEIIVTSSRVGMPLRQIGTSVSVIDRQAIQARGFNSLADVLRFEPAVSVSNTGGPGKATALRIRGENGFRTRVLLDGIDTTNTSAPQAGPHFEHLLSAQTERVEILRGPQGLMYGADAGGVVSITTPRGEPGFSGGLSGEGGRYGTHQVAGHLTGGSERFDASLSGARFETDGFNARTTDNLLRDGDGYENATLHGRLGWQLTNDLRSELVAHRVDGENQFDSCFNPLDFTPTDHCEDSYRQDAWRALLAHIGDSFSNQLAYGDNEVARDFYADGEPSYASRGNLKKLEYLGSWSADDDLRLVYGADWQRAAIDDGSFDRERDQRGYYAEYQGGFAERLFVTAGLRHDDNDDFGSHSTWRVSGAYLISTAGGELKLRASAGTGFRAPSLYEIGYNRGPFAFPPAAQTELDAEESSGYDVGLAFYAERGWYVESVYFDQRVENEIYFDLAGFSGYLQGDGESRSRGVELIAEAALPLGLSLSGNYTYNEAQDAAGEARLRAPEHLGNLSLGYASPGGRLSLNLQLRLARDAVDGGNLAMDDYEVVDLVASYRLHTDLELYGRVENLTDEQYQEVPTYYTSGAAAYAGVRYTF
jgi:vitamin B12 transporter